MIPSAAVMEVRCSLLCCTGTDVSVHGRFPLLGSTKGLLEKLGFGLCDGNNGNGEQCHPLATALVQVSSADATTTPKDATSEPFPEILLRALDDIRDLRHLVEEEGEPQQQDGKAKLSQREKRMFRKVDLLEKQRAKLQEKKRNDSKDSIGDNTTGEDQAHTAAEIRDAWMRIARTYNSARLLLFLFSEETGLDTLASGGVGSVPKELSKAIQKLSLALEVLKISSVTAKPQAESGGGGDDGDDFQGISTDAINRWEAYVARGLRSRRRKTLDPSTVGASAADADENGESNDEIDTDYNSDLDFSIADSDNGYNSDLHLCTDDDSSLGSDAMDIDEKSTDAMDIDEKSTDKAKEIFSNSVNGQPKSRDDRTDENGTDPVKAGDDSSDEYISALRMSWNNLLDKLMNDFVSSTDTYSGAEGVEFLEQAFENLRGYLRGSDDTTLHDRAKKLDEQFSLIVGITGSKEYQTRTKYLLSIEKLRRHVEQKIRLGRKNNNLHDARLDVYGSCLSGLSLGKNADVDLSLTFSDAIEKKMDFEAGDLTAKKYNRYVVDTVYKIKRKLESSRSNGGILDFCKIEAVPRARVPVIKGVYIEAKNPHSEDGSLHFDICLLNDIAVANSGLIKEYSDVDIRVKSLMIAVKRWTKDNQINAAQDNTLSSYTWMNLVIFYLQTIGFVPNLQCPSLMKECKHGAAFGNSKRRQDNINNLDTAYLKWKGQVDRVWKRSPGVDKTYASVSILLLGFFRFYAQEFPIHLYMVSIKRGGQVRLPKTMFPDKASLHLCIEDPFETYDSHFPHDLGMPADEGGSMYIASCFRDAMENLQQVLFLGSNRGVVELWPIATPGMKAAAGGGRSSRKKKKDPDMTVVIEKTRRKGIKEEDILRIFQPFADLTKSRIVGSSLTKSGTAFVDYDSVEAVYAALEAHAKCPLEWNGEALNISQKNQPTRREARKSMRKEAKEKKAKAQNARSNGKNDDKDNNGSSSSSNNNNGSNGNAKSKGDPEKTLVVQSLSGRLSDKAVAKMFRPFASQTSSKLLSTDLVKKQMVAFVEYDSPAAVQAALKEHSANPMEWNGKVLSVSQKHPPGWKNKKRRQKQAQEGAQEGAHENHASPAAKPAKPRGGKKSGGRNPAARRKNPGSSNGNKNDSGSKPIVRSNESIQQQLGGDS